MKKILLTFMGACLLLAPAGCVDQINLSNLGGAAADLHTAATLDDAELKEMCVQMRKKRRCRSQGRIRKQQVCHPPEKNHGQAHQR